MVSHCEKLKRKKEKEAKAGAKPDQKKQYPKCPTCGKTNHPEERCWKGAGAHLRPKRNKPEAKEDRSEQTDDEQPQDDHKQSTSSFNPNSHKKQDPKN